MTVGDILNDTEKVIFLVNIICKPSYIFTTFFIHNIDQFIIKIYQGPLMFETEATFCINT